MPYPTINDLPEQIRAHLPAHAQEIFRAAFNNAWSRGAGKTREEREASAHRIAWAAVKRRYRKQGDQWIERD